MNHKKFLVFVVVLLTGCNTVGSDRTRKLTDRTLHPIDCTSAMKKEECRAVANMDKKMQKKTAKSAQSEQVERRARLAKLAENKKINDEKAKVKIEPAPLPLDNTIVSKPDLKAQKQIDIEKKNKDFSTSMDCVKSNIRKKDDVRSHVRAVAYELAMLCRKKGIAVDSIANASIPLISQSRAPKNTK